MTREEKDDLVKNYLQATLQALPGIMIIGAISLPIILYHTGNQSRHLDKEVLEGHLRNGPHKGTAQKSDVERQFTQIRTDLRELRQEQSRRFDQLQQLIRSYH